MHIPIKIENVERFATAHEWFRQVALFVAFIEECALAVSIFHEVSEPQRATVTGLACVIAGELPAIV